MRKVLSVLSATRLGFTITTQAHASVRLATPTQFAAGPLGKMSVQGILSGVGIWQSNPESAPALTPFGANRAAQFEIDNAQLILRKDTGIVQFCIQGGAYDLPALGKPLVSTSATVNNTHGPLPVAYIKVAPASALSIEIGKLPSLIDKEGTWAWQNGNIEQGLLWNDESTVNRGIQINYAAGPVALSLSWNDGFYSRSYHVLTGLATFRVNEANSVSVSFYHRFHKSLVAAPITPTALDNSQIYALMYTHKGATLSVSPYLQYIYSPKSVKLGYTNTAHVGAAALLANYRITPIWSLAGRAEYKKKQRLPYRPGCGRQSELAGIWPRQPGVVFDLDADLSGRRFVRPL